MKEVTDEEIKRISIKWNLPESDLTKVRDAFRNRFGVTLLPRTAEAFAKCARSTERSCYSIALDSQFFFLKETPFIPSRLVT